MGLFKRAKKEEEKISDMTSEFVNKEEPNPRILEQDIVIKENQEKLDEITSRLASVKEEYDSIVGNLMSVKREYNEKKSALESINQEYQKIKSEIEQNESKLQQSKNVSENILKSQKNIEDLKKEESKIKEEYEKIKQKITESQTTLHEIKNQQIQSQTELDEINSKIYNAREELRNLPSELNPDTDSSFSKTEKLLIERELADTKKNESNNVIEAASAIVASLKSKLNSKEHELLAIQQLLQKERDAHNETKNQLEQLKQSSQL